MKRCCQTVTFGADQTGERAIECNRPAVFECEHCGPLCAECYEQTHCIFAEHREAVSA